AIGGDRAPRLAIRAGGVWRQAAAVGQTDRLGLADGFAAGGARLTDLPEESPEDQTQIPAAVAGMLMLVLLGQVTTGNKSSEQSLELMEGRTGGGAQAAEVSGEAAGQ